MKLNLGKTLKDIRKARNLTIYDVQANSGVNPTFLSKIENGKRDASLSTLSTLSNCYKVPLSIIFVLSEKSDEGSDFYQIEKTMKNLVMKAIKAKESQ